LLNKLFIHGIIVFLFWILFSCILDEDGQENVLKIGLFVETVA
jgi:hypothetical protein